MHGAADKDAVVVEIRRPPFFVSGAVYAVEEFNRMAGR